jgi:hypothetical protein
MYGDMLRNKLRALSKRMCMMHAAFAMQTAIVKKGKINMY